MKAKSPSRGPLLTLLVHQGPKIELSETKIVIFPIGTFRRFFFFIASVQKKAKNIKIKKKEKGKKDKGNNKRENRCPELKFS